MTSWNWMAYVWMSIILQIAKCSTLNDDGNERKYEENEEEEKKIKLSHSCIIKPNSLLFT